MPKESASKRQKVAQQEFEHLDELGADAFSVFLQDHSKYIPYRVLYQTIARNKNLIQWFKQFATDNWWRKRTKNDFYDFYDAAINYDDNTVNEHTQNWLKQTITIHENLWSKPWKIVYMVCYGMVTLISTTETEIKLEELVRMPMEFAAYDTQDTFSGDIVLQTRGDTGKVFSWITGDQIDELDVSDNTDMPMPIRNGFCLPGDEEDIVYTRKDKTQRFVDVEETATKKTRKLSDLVIYQTTKEIDIFRTTDWKQHTESDAFPSIFPLCLDYYFLDDTIYQFPDIEIQKVNLPLRMQRFDIFGPYNFTDAKFTFLVRTPDEMYSFYRNGEIETTPFGGWLRPEYVLCSYGFSLQMTRDKEARIYTPSGKYSTIKFTHPSQSVIQLCGPFMCFTRSSQHDFETIDFWSTLQRKRTEPIEFISSQHCHNCGFIASLQCDQCTSVFCDETCAIENTNVSECKHGSM